MDDERTVAFAMKAIDVAETVGAWIEFHANAHPKAAKTTAFLVALLILRRFTFLRLLLARGIVSIARFIGGKGLQASLEPRKPSLSSQTPNFAANCTSRDAQIPAPSQAYGADHRPSPRPKSPSRIYDRVRHRRARGPPAIQTRSRESSSAPSSSTATIVDSPLSGSADLDGGDDYFVDAIDGGAHAFHSHDSLLPGGGGSLLTLALDAKNIKNTSKDEEEQEEDENVAEIVDRYVRELAGGNFSQVKGEDLLACTGLASLHPRHQFTSYTNQAVLEFLRLEHAMRHPPVSTTAPKWKLEWEKDGTKMHSYPEYGSSIPIVRGSGIFPVPFTVHEIFSVIRSTAARKKWDPRFDTGTPLHIFNVDDALAHTVMKASFPVAARDMVVVLTTRRPQGRGSELVHAVTSVRTETGEVPGVVVPREGEAGRVRAEVGVAAWYLRENGGGIVGAAGVEAVYCVRVDPKGTLPSSVVKLVQNQTPLAIRAVADYLLAHGPVPFVLHTDDVRLNPSKNLQFTSETWDPKTRLYKITMDVLGEGARLTLALPKALTEVAGGVALAISVRVKGDDAVPEGVQVRSGVVASRVVGGEARWRAMKGVVSEATGAVVQVWLEGVRESMHLALSFSVGVEGGVAARGGVSVNGVTAPLLESS